ncbi:hypothetical protein D9M71_654820 [compost metagenome]
MAISPAVFVKGLVAHIEDESSDEAGRFGLLCEGATIAMSYIHEINNLEAKATTEITAEMVTPEAMPLPTDNPLVELFYGESSKVY